jgi:lipopolysaccharide export system permease protein
VYEIDEAGLPTAITDAAWAVYEDGGTWALQDAVRYELSTDGMRAVAPPARIELGGNDTGTADTMHLDSRSLAALIAEAQRDGYDTTRFRVDYHVRLAGAWACLVLPAALLFVGVAGRILRRGPAFVMLLAIALGIGYVLLTDLGIAIGYAKVVPPAVAGWGVTALYGLGAGALATRYYA